jgi:hypothetical protein
VNQQSSTIVGNLHLGKDDCGWDIAKWLTSQLKAHVSPDSLAKQWNTFVERWDDGDYDIGLPGVPGSELWLNDADELADELPSFYKAALESGAERIIDFIDSAGYHDLVAVKGNPDEESIEDFVHQEK